MFSSVNPLSALRSSAMASNLVLAFDGVELIVKTQLKNKVGNFVTEL